MTRINLVLFAFVLSLTSAPKLRAQETLSLSQGADANLDLNKAMQMALDHSFERRSAEEDQASSEARQAVIKGTLGPKLSVEASRGWIDTSVNKLAGKTLPTGQRYPDEISAVGVIVSQPITQIFTNTNRLEAEQKLGESARTQVAVEGNDAKLHGAEAYIAALKAVRFLAISRESRDLIERQKKDAASLRSSGKLADLDYSRFELAASESNSQVLDAEAQLRVASDNLHEVLGLPTEQKLVLTELHDVRDIPNDPAKERLELEGAEKRVEALESQIKAQKIDYWPQVNAFARYSRDFAAEDVNVNFLGFQVDIPKEDFRDQFSYGFNLQWDIWDWGTRAGRVADVSSQYSKAKIQKEAVATRLRLETSQADAEFHRAQQNLQNAQLAEKLSADILRSFDLKFRNRLATTTDLLSVQRDRIRAQAQLANATYDLHAALLRKRRASGVLL